MSKRKISLGEIAKKAGLDRHTCHCGKVFDAKKALRTMIEIILKEVKKDNEVMVINLGTFYRATWRRKKVKNNVLFKGKKLKKKSHILKFKQSSTAKKFLNKKKKKDKEVKNGRR